MAVDNILFSIDSKITGITEIDKLIRVTEAASASVGKLQKSETSLTEVTLKNAAANSKLGDSSAKASKNIDLQAQAMEKLKNKILQQQGVLKRSESFNIGKEQLAIARLSQELKNPKLLDIRLKNKEIGSQVEKVGKSVKVFDNQAKGLSNSFLGLNASSLAAVGGVAAIGSALIGAGKEIFDATRKFEALKTELKFFAEGAGASEQGGQALFDRLNQFALENPLANLETTIANVKDLLNKDINIGLAEQLGKSFVDITAGSLEAQNALARVVGQVKLQGRVLYNDLQQFTTANVNIISLLSKLPEFANKSAKEIKELTSEGKIGFEQVAQALIKSTEQGGKFFGRSAAAAKTLNGQVLALEDALFNLKATIGGTANKEMTEFVEKMVKATNAMREWFSSAEGQTFTSNLVQGTNEILVAIENLSAALSGEKGGIITGFMGRVARDWKVASDIISGSIDIVRGVAEANQSRRELAGAALERDGVGQSLDFIAAGLGFTSLVGQETKIFAEKKKNEEAYANEVQNTYRRLQKIKEAAVVGRSILGNQDKEEIENARKILSELKITSAKDLPGSYVIGEENKKILEELLKQQDESIVKKKELDTKDLDERKKAKEKALKEEKDRQQKLKDLQDKDIQILKDYLQKMIDLRNDNLTKIGEYNDDLQKIIISNNDKIAEINEDDGTNSIEKIKARGERERQAESRNLQERKAQLEKEQKDYLSKLAEARKDLQEKQTELAKEGSELVGKRGGGFISNAELNKQVREFQAYNNEITAKLAETQSKIGIISGQISTISGLKTQKDINEYLKKIREAFIDVNEFVLNAQKKNNTSRLELLKEGFEKDLLLLNDSNANEIDETNKFYNDKITEFKKFAKENKIRSEISNKEIFKINVQRNAALILLDEKYYQQKNELQIKELERQIKINQDLSQGNISTFEEIASLQSAQAYQGKSGKTGSFADLKKQKELQRIEDEKNLSILNQRIKSLEIEISLESQKAALLSNGGAFSEESSAKIKALFAELAKKREEKAKAESDAEQKELNEKVQKIIERIEYAKQFSDIVFSIFDKINQQEINALDKQIGVQQKRLNSAKELQEKGNAELLQLEQNRLDALEQKRELAANRQIALQRKQQIAAQTLAVAQVIAQAVSTPGGVFAIPLAVASLLATLAQGLSQAREYNEGTRYVTGKRARNTPDDNIPAWLTEGERVIPKRLNEKYFEVYNAIENGYYDNWAHSINRGIKVQNKAQKTQQAQNSGSSIDYDLLAKSIAKYSKNESKSTVNFSLDENGFRIRGETVNQRLEFRRKNR